MIHALAFALTLVGLSFSSLPVQADTSLASSLPAQPHAGSRERQFMVYVPDGLNGPAPVMMALHACQQSHDGLRPDRGLTAAAGLPYGDDAASESPSACAGSANVHPGSGVLSDMRAERANAYPIPLMVRQDEPVAGVGPPPSPPSPPRCTQITAAPAAHIATERAKFGGLFGVRALSTGDAKDIGFAWDFYWAEVVLYQGADGRWFAQPPPGCKP